MAGFFLSTIRSWWRGRRTGAPVGTPTAAVAAQLKEALIGEAEAVVEGRVVERLLSQGQVVPPWAWLNALVHRPPKEVSAIAVHRRDSWARAAFEIATALQRLPADKATQITAGFLQPLELSALAGHAIPGGASQVVKALERRLDA